MISKSRILVAIAILCAIPGLRADEVIRIMAANISSGTSQSYDPGEGNRIFQGLVPDIALVQELNVGISPNKNTAATYRAWVNDNFGPTFSYFVESGKNIPNGIVSRHPILTSGVWNDSELTDREFVWARINIPGDKDLWAISVHLKASSGTDNSTRRNNQAAQILNYIGSQGIPASDYLVIGGDFNTYSRTEDCIQTLSSVFVTGSPWPADQAGDQDTNGPRSNDFDWVLANSGLNALKTPLIVGSRTFTNGLVYDSRVTTPYSLLPSPILSGDSGAEGMQHMAVIRAFLIPVNDPPVIVSAATSPSPEIAPDLYQVIRAASANLSVAATDDGGEPSLKYTWSKTAGAANPVSFSPNGTNAAKNCTATFSAPGDYTLTVAVQDVPGLMVTGSVKIRVIQTAVGLALSPPSVTLQVNQSQTFSVALTDQFARVMSGPVVWSANGGGNLDASGKYAATTAGGPYQVTATGGGFSRISNVTVTPAPAALSFSGLTQSYDGSGKPVMVTTVPPGLAHVLLYESPVYPGSSTPPVNAGNYTVTAVITNPNYQGSSSVTLSILPDEWAFWKNSWFTPEERDAGLADDSEDPDFDLQSNLVEYALGSNPRQFTPRLTLEMNQAGLSITFTRPAGLPGIQYTGEVSEDLSNWSPVAPEVLGSDGGIETVRAADPAAPDPLVPRFLRLRIERE